MQRIIDRFAATEGAFVLTNDLAILPTLQSIRISPDLYGAADRTGIDGVTVVIKPDQTGLGY